MSCRAMVGAFAAALDCLSLSAVASPSNYPERPCGETRSIALPTGRTIRVSGGGASVLRLGAARWVIWSGVGCSTGVLTFVAGEAPPRRVRMRETNSFSPMFAAPHGVAFNVVVPGDIGRLDYYAEDGSRHSAPSADAITFGDEEILLLVPSPGKSSVQRVRPWPHWKKLGEVVADERCWRIKSTARDGITLAGCGDDEATERRVPNP
jgi:hypothetical protein